MLKQAGTFTLLATAILMSFAATAEANPLPLQTSGQDALANGNFNEIYQTTHQQINLLNLQSPLDALFPMNTRSSDVTPIQKAQQGAKTVGSDNKTQQMLNQSALPDLIRQPASLIPQLLR